MQLICCKGTASAKKTARINACKGLLPTLGTCRRSITYSLRLCPYPHVLDNWIDETGYPLTMLLEKDQEVFAALSCSKSVRIIHATLNHASDKGQLLYTAEVHVGIFAALYPGPWSCYPGRREPY